MQAWLNNKPEGCAHTNGDQYGHLLPELSSDVRYLPGLLHEIGTVRRTGSGLVPLDYAEIYAWCQLMHESLEPFEVSAVRLMSEVYVRIASNSNSPCPVDDDRIQDQIMAANIASWIAAAGTDA